MQWQLDLFRILLQEKTSKGDLSGYREDFSLTVNIINIRFCIFLPKIFSVQKKLHSDKITQRCDFQRCDPKV